MGGAERAGVLVSSCGVCLFFQKDDTTEHGAAREAFSLLTKVFACTAARQEHVRELLRDQERVQVGRSPSSRFPTCFFPRRTSNPRLLPVLFVTWKALPPSCRPEKAISFTVSSSSKRVVFGVPSQRQKKGSSSAATMAAASTF